MKTTPLSPETVLPLTCSRTGTCCHGKLIYINPWELYALAQEKKIWTEEFRELYTDNGGISLKFNGAKGWNDQEACSQYVQGFGCSVHQGRPLACRLYPLGRQLQSNEVAYVYRGEKFPCLEGCPEVVNLPQVKVGDYLKGQATGSFEEAQDFYVELMQNLADMAFEFLLDTGLSESGDTATLNAWRRSGIVSADALILQIGEDWVDAITLPEIPHGIQIPSEFTQKHAELLQLKLQLEFGTLQTLEDYQKGAVLLMNIALQLARSLGANPQELSEMWIVTAKEHGALE